MGFTTIEAKHKYQEIVKTNTATQAEEKPEKPVNQKKLMVISAKN